MNINNEENENTSPCEEDHVHGLHCGCGHGSGEIDVETGIPKKQLAMELSLNPNFIKEHNDAQKVILERYKEIQRQKKS